MEPDSPVSNVSLKYLAVQMLYYFFNALFFSTVWRPQMAQQQARNPRVELVDNPLTCT
jgi:hypothetical protein